jgi:hypothetical protein
MAVLLTNSVVVGLDDIPEELYPGGPDFKVHVAFYLSSVTITLVNPMNGIMHRDKFSETRTKLLRDHLYPLRENALLTKAQFMCEVERMTEVFFCRLREYKGFIGINRTGMHDTNTYEEESETNGERV